MTEGGPQNPGDGREALLVKLAIEIDVTPSSFLAISPELRRSSTISKLAAMALFSPVSEKVKHRINIIKAAALDAGVLNAADLDDGQ